MSGIKIALYTLLVFAGLFLAAGAAAMLPDGGGAWIALLLLGAAMVAVPLWRMLAYRSGHAVTEAQLARARKKGRPVLTGTFTLVSGLDIPAGARCSLAYWPDHLAVTALGRTYELPLARIAAAEAATVRTVRRQYVSSAGGAVAGGMLFGPIGALLGGAARPRSVRDSSVLLLVAYTAPESGTDMRYLVFQPGPWTAAKAKRFAAALAQAGGAGAASVPL